MSNKGIGVYLIRNTETGTAYVGSTIVGFKSRWGKHLHMLRNKKHPNRYLQRAWNKYGESAFRFEVAEKVEDKNRVLEREQYWLTVFWDADKAYNLTPTAASNQGIEWSEQVKKKVSKGMKRAWKENYETIYAYTKSAPVRKKLSRAAKERWGDPDFKERVADKIAQTTFPGLVSPEGKEYRNIRNLTKFCKKHGLNYQRTWQVASGRVKSSQGWKHINWKDDPRQLRKPYSRSYAFVAPDGTEYKNIKNLAAFCRERGLSSRSMGFVHNERTNQHRGWRKLKD